MCACGMAGEHMASPIIAFLAGAGTGYLKQRDVEDQRKRDDEDQQFKRDQREVWRKQQVEADSLNQSLKQAQAPAEIVEGTLGDQSAGPPVPAALSRGSTGQPAQTFRMVAPGVNKSFSTAAEAQQAAADYAKPEAMNQRVVAAYRGAGMVDKAMEVDRNAMQGQAARMQLDDGIKARAAKDANARLMQAMGGGAAGLQSFFDRSNLVNGAQVGFDTGKDGKVQFYTLDSEGKKNLMGAAVENTQEALSRAVMPYWQGLDAIQYMDILYRDAQAQRAQANSDRTFALNERKVNADISARNQQLSIASGKASGRAAAASGFDLLDGFDDKQSRGAAIDRVKKTAEDRAAMGKPMSNQEFGEAVDAAYRADKAAHQQGAQNAYIQGALQRDLGSTKGNAQAYAMAYEKALQLAPAAQLKAWGYEAPGKADEPSGKSTPQKATPEKAPPVVEKAPPVVVAQQSGSGKPSIAALDAASVRVDKARSALAAIRSSRAPGLRDGSAALEAHAQKIKAAQDELDAANLDYRNAVPPFVAAAYGTRRK